MFTVYRNVKFPSLRTLRIDQQEILLHEHSHTRWSAVTRFDGVPMTGVHIVHDGCRLKNYSFGIVFHTFSKPSTALVFNLALNCYWRFITMWNRIVRFLPARYYMRKHGLCCRQVSVHQSVRHVGGLYAHNWRYRETSFSAR